MPKTISYTINAARLAGSVAIQNGTVRTAYQLGSYDGTTFTQLAAGPGVKRAGTATVDMPTGDTQTTPDQLIAEVTAALKAQIATQEGLDLTNGDVVLDVPVTARA